MTCADIQPGAYGEPQSADKAGRPSLLEWQARLQESAGFRAIALKDRVKRIAYLFQANVAQYKSLVARLHDPAVSFPILDVRNPEAHDDLLMEAERLLHNVLTAMSTRVDQQRRFMQKYFQDDPALTREYLERITSVFAASPEAAFPEGTAQLHRPHPAACGPEQADVRKPVLRGHIHLAPPTHLGRVEQQHENVDRRSGRSRRDRGRRGRLCPNGWRLRQVAVRPDRAEIQGGNRSLPARAG